MRQRTRRPVDWQQVKARLAATERALAVGERDIDDGTRRAALRARAEALAADRARVAAGPQIEVVEFELAARRFAIEAAFVREVRHLADLTSLPCTPPFVSGIIGAHGRILAVIDLKTFFELTESGFSDLTKVIILEQGDVEFGILAERILGTQRLPLSELQAPLPAPVGRRAHCVRGVAPGPVVVLDGERLLAEPELVVDDEVSP